MREAQLFDLVERIYQAAFDPKLWVDLVEKLEADSTTVTLVNTDQVAGRRVIVQGGAYAEHRFDSVSVNGERIDVDGASFAVELAPGAGATLKIGTQRYANQPSFAFPWDRTA